MKKFNYTCPESGKWFISESGDLFYEDQHLKTFGSAEIAADWAYQFAQSKILIKAAGNISVDDPLHQLILKVSHEVLNPHHRSEEMEKLLLHSDNRSVLILANQIANLTEEIKDLGNWQLSAGEEFE